ncbi:CusA/CzcA family heavy metal efflux RND transporter OS=Stutzerimonas stutzeri OX=316 GN=CXK95_09355 PE=3 SV=1 [Stutzerimonas stutzeri]
MPRYADETDAGGAPTVRIDAGITHNLGVRLATVSRGQLARNIEAVGVLGLNDRDVALVQARAAGFVERVYRLAPGDVLTAGAPLVDLLIPEWVAAQEEFLALRRSGDRALLDGARQRLRLVGMPAEAIRQLERSGRVQALQTVRAPIGGVLQELDVREGMSVDAGAPLARINGLSFKLLEEFIVVALVCGLFLWHLRSSLVAIVSLPIGVLLAFAVMRYQGINANIMSLGGIAIAIGAMVDAAVVMIENAHKKVEAWRHANPGRTLEGEEHWRVMTQAAQEVGPALFFCLLIITLSFIPVFTLEAQEGRLFGPLAFTKTYAMAAAAGLSVTLVPVLMGYWIRGRLPDETHNPLNRGLIRVYRPALDAVLEYPKTTLVAALLILATTLWPMTRLGGEFLPPMDEGDLLYMPSALPGLSAQKAAQLLQQTDRMIRTVPEVATVFGKAGRAESATDPAPLEMFETTIQFKPREQWRAGMTPEKLVEELDRAVQVPGLTNIWIPPIRNRIDMLATGIKSPIGVKIAGANLEEIDRVSQQVEAIAKTVPGVSSALAERLVGGRYIDIDIDRQDAARYGLNIADVQAIVAGAIGGETVGETVEGLARYPISVRYPREWRDSPQALEQLPILTPQGAQITLGSVARVRVSDGPPMLRSENARLSGWVYVDVRGRDIASVVADLRQAVSTGVELQPGMSLSYSGQFEFLERANERLKLVVPATLLIIFVLLYLTFGRIDEALLIMLTLPFALTGGVWFLYLMGYNLSVATGVGFIALAGVAAEFGVIMLLYLKHAWSDRQQAGRHDEAALCEAIREGAVQRVRPKAMTVAVIVAGLLPILLGAGTGSEVMSRIAAPMVGGMLSAPLLSLLVLPAAYRLMRRRQGRELEGQ